jgi:phosphoribosyl 1,2-cyclic phosphodiesterase
MPFKTLRRHVNIRDVVGCIVSHSHADHGGYVKDYESRGIQTYTPDNTPEEFVRIFGGFKVRSFAVVHDVPAYGYLIHHPEMGTMPFITDTHYIPWKFNMNNLMIECNYSEGILKKRVEQEKIHPALADRIAYSHVSLETCIDFLGKNDTSKLDNIILIHLSDGNSDSEFFKKEVERVTGVPTYIATKNLTLRL